MLKSSIFNYFLFFSLAIYGYVKNLWLNFSVFLISLIATSGSLYFSEVMFFIPCEFCWYQRIFMYPVFIISIVSLTTKDLKFWKYVLPLSLIGMFIAIYHVFIQFSSSVSSMCTGDVPCSVKYIEWFGFVTIPVLSLIAFTFINILIISSILINKKNKSNEIH